MKKLIVLIALSAAIASAYCERGHKVSERFVGNHKEAVYEFSSGYLTFNFAFGEMAPYSIRYDFYRGKVCY